MPSREHAPRRSSAEISRRNQERILIRRIAGQIKARKRKRPYGEAGGEPVPVEPNRPNNLTGGAAAALEFDD